MNHVAHRLALLMALAGDHQDVTVGQHGGGRPDRLAAVADFLGVARAGQNLRPDRGRRFAARVVVGDDHRIGQTGGDLAHQRPLGAIAIATGAEHHDQLAAHMRTQRAQHGLQAVGRMGIVHIGFAAARALADALKPPGGADQRFQTRQRLFDTHAGGDAQACGDQCVGRLKGSGQRQAQVVHAAVVAHAQSLAVEQRRARDERQPLARRADAHHRLTGADGGRGEGRIGPGIGVQHRGPAPRQQGVEQAQFGGAIDAHGAVVVEVVLGQVEEARGG